MGPLDEFSYMSTTDLCVYLLGEVKKLYGSGPRAHDLFLAHGTFFIFLFHFSLSLITRKATLCGKKIKYVIVKRLFDL